jgi:hypothetical protein
LGEDHGSPSSQNAGTLPDLSPVPACRTAKVAQTISFKGRITLMMLERLVR